LARESVGSRVVAERVKDVELFGKWLVEQSGPLDHDDSARSTTGAAAGKGNRCVLLVADVDEPTSVRYGDLHSGSR
jgi:hypothetical protein